MSIFPDFAKCYTHSAPQKSQHRFTKLARRVAGDMWAAVRVTLEVFSGESAKNWPTEKLFSYLKSAEELVREALRLVAAELHVFPAASKARSGAASTRPIATETRAPYFSLKVKSVIAQADEEETRKAPGPIPRQAKNREDQDKNTQQPTEARITASKIEKRLGALEGVIADPVRHAARMARALYREGHDTERGCITVKCKDDLLLDYASQLTGRRNTNFGINGRKNFAQMQAFIRGPD